MIELADGDAYLGLREWCTATNTTRHRFSRVPRSLLRPYEQPTLYLGGSLHAPLFRRSRVSRYAQESDDYRLFKKHRTKLAYNLRQAEKRALIKEGDDRGD